MKKTIIKKLKKSPYWIKGLIIGILIGFFISILTSVRFFYNLYIDYLPDNIYRIIDYLYFNNFFITLLILVLISGLLFLVLYESIYLIKKYSTFRLFMWFLIIFFLLIIFIILFGIFIITKPPYNLMPTIYIIEPPSCGYNKNCTENEYCLNNLCQKVECSNLEVVYNHSCWPKTFLTQEDIINKEFSTLKIETPIRINKKEDLYFSLDVVRGSRLVLYELYINNTLIQEDYIREVYNPITLIGNIDNKYLQEGYNDIIIVFKIEKFESIEETIYPFPENKYLIKILNSSYLFSPNLKGVYLKNPILKKGVIKFYNGCIDPDFHNYRFYSWCETSEGKIADSCDNDILIERFCNNNKCDFERVDCNGFCDMMYDSKGKCNEGVCKC